MSTSERSDAKLNYDSTNCKLRTVCLCRIYEAVLIYSSVLCTVIRNLSAIILNFLNALLKTLEQ